MVRIPPITIVALLAVACGSNDAMVEPSLCMEPDGTYFVTVAWYSGTCQASSPTLTFEMTIRDQVATSDLGNGTAQPRTLSNGDCLMTVILEGPEGDWDMELLDTPAQSHQNYGSGTFSLETSSGSCQHTFDVIALLPQ